MRFSNPSSGFQIRRGGGSVVVNTDGTISLVGNTDITGTLDVTGLITATLGVKYGSDVTLTRGAANRLDLASGDDFYIVSGRIGIGVAPVASIAFFVGGGANITTGADQKGLLMSPLLSSASTGSGRVIDITLTTEAAAFTMAIGAGLHIRNAAKGAGSTITTLIGLDVASQTRGDTNFAIRTASGLVEFGENVTVSGTLGLGTTVTLTEGSANVLELATGDSFEIVNGRMGIGTAPVASKALLIGAASIVTSGATQYGVLSDVMFGGDATSSGSAIGAQVRTAVASFTMGLGVGVLINNAVKGAGSTITTLVGLEIVNQTEGGTNFAIRTGTGLVQFGENVTAAGTLAWGGGATILSSDKVRPDYAAIRFDDNSSAETIDLINQYHLVARFATNGLDEVSTSDQANNRLTVGDGRDYNVALCGSAEAAGGSKTFVFDVFEISQSTANITGITQATPGVVTASGHGFSNGDLCKITGVVGMTEVNDKIFKVAGVSGASFNLQDDEGVNIATGAFGAWSSGGTVALATKTFAHSDRTFSNASGFGAFGSHWYYLATSGDAMEFYLKNKTDATDITFEHLNLTISGL